MRGRGIDMRRLRLLPPALRSGPWLGPGILIATLAALAAGGTALAEDYHSNPWLLSWIPTTCCVTNDCCWEVSEDELRPLSGDRWQVLATGQVVTRTDWAPDGKFYRCACDLAHRLLLHPQPGQDRRGHHRRDLAAHDLAHQLDHLVVEDLAVLDGALQGFLGGDGHGSGRSGELQAGKA